MSQGMTAADPGGAKGGHAPLSLLKLVTKKMAAISGPLYFMFLGPPPPSDHAGSDAAMNTFWLRDHPPPSGHKQIIWLKSARFAIDIRIAFLF